MSNSAQNRSFRTRSASNVLPWYGKTKPNTTKDSFTNQKKYTTHKINTKKLKPRLVASYDIGLETEKAYSGFGAS